MKKTEKIWQNDLIFGSSLFYIKPHRDNLKGSSDPSYLTITDMLRKSLNERKHLSIRCVHKNDLIPPGNRDLATFHHPYQFSEDNRYFTPVVYYIVKCCLYQLSWWHPTVLNTAQAAAADHKIHCVWNKDNVVVPITLIKGSFLFSKLVEWRYSWILVRF